MGGFKVVNIHARTGRRPVFAAGNSDGDLAMLEYVEPGRGLSLLLLHDDSEREFEQLSGLSKAEQAADSMNWMRVSMRNDFKRMYPAESKLQ